MNIGTIWLQDLPQEVLKYLTDLALKGGNGEIPVYYRNEAGEVFFIEGYVLRDNKAFERTAPNCLYRGGALLKLLIKHGQVVLFDERYQWLRMIGGIARFSEGHDLTRTAVREAVVEELAVLADGEKVRLVPEGTKDLVGLSVPGWGITVQGIVETGSLSIVDSYFNDANRAFEVVVQWDISSWDGLVVLHSEDWFRGGRTGFTPFVINGHAEIVGMFNGRQGYIQMPVTGIHPTLKACL